MRAGVLQQCDRPNDLYSRPKNLFVAAFIGSPAMNLFETTLSDDGSSLKIGSQTIDLRGAEGLPAGLQQYRGRSVTIGIRAEDLPLAEGDSLHGPLLRGHVEAVEALGSELLVHFSIDATRISPDSMLDEGSDDFVANVPIDIVGEGIARVHPRASLRAGENAPFAIFPERLHFFDPVTQAAIET
jgi:multiple sugar transport system ATP-binding protein